MNSSFGNISGALPATLLILLVLLMVSVLYNRQIEKAGNSIEGWSWLLVVIGVAYTLIAITLLDLVLPEWNAGLIGLLAFSVAGFPMAYGGIQRYIEMHNRTKKAMHE